MLNDALSQAIAAEMGHGLSSELMLSPNGEITDTPMPTTNREFLAAIFDHYEDAVSGARPQVLAFINAPEKQKQWRGQRLIPNGDLTIPEMNGYFTLAVYRPDTTTKKAGDCTAICGLMLDDLGTKALPLSRLAGCPPTYIIETSAGNYQAGYLFNVPITDVKQVEALNKATIDANMCDPGATGPTSRWGRLPFASNTKRTPPFKCKLIEFHPERRYTIGQIVEGLELDYKAPGRPKVAGTRPKKLAHVHDAEDVYTPRADENAVVTALKAKGLYKQPLGDGRHDVTCPWLAEHTDRIDHGAAYFEPTDLYPMGGFKCQHSHGATKRLGALLEFLTITFQAAKHKPTISIQAGELHRIADAAERELAATGRYYQRGGLMVAIQTDPSTRATEIQPMKLPGLVRALAGVAVWQRYDARSNQWVVADPPDRHAGVIFASERYDHLPALAGLARQPFIREGGSLMKDSGFDPATGLFGVFDARQFNIPTRPTAIQAAAALDKLRDLLIEFEFGNPHDEAAALAAILTAAIRPTLTTAPMFHVRAPQISSGKSYLTSIIAAFASPTPGASLGFPTNDEECEKVLLSTLLTAPAVICFDNLTGDLVPFKKLCSVLTEESVSGRILGVSKNATVSTRALFLSSGNNVGPVRDMGRRAITVNLDPRCETPATRRFKADPLRLVRSERGGYVSAALTVVTAWLTNGKPMADCEPFGGYGQWRDLVCQPLLWLGLPDPAISGFESLETDPDRETLGRLMTAWRCKFGDTPTQVRAVVRVAEVGVSDDTHDADTVELLEVLQEIAEVRGVISRQRLGRWIGRHAKRNVGGFRLVKDGHGNGADRWRVMAADAD